MPVALPARADVVVLGAGIVGICVALHLQKRGRAVVLVDRRGAAEETSFGNAGLIQREGVYPYGFPHDFGALLRYAFNRTIDAYYHVTALPQLAPFLWQYWRYSRPAEHTKVAHRYATLIEHCVAEHEALAREAGASDIFTRKGWLKLFRTERERDKRFNEAERVHREFGVEHDYLDARAVREMEPHLAPVIAGALHYTQPVSVDDPQGLALAYLRRFGQLGGTFVQGNAQTLQRDGESWRVDTVRGPLAAGSAVIALGPWSGDVVRPFGYELPLAVKRGYHMHYRPAGEARLNHPVLDFERGYFLAPMRRGIRLTTGAEFARRDAIKTPVQLGRAEPIARDLFPLAERLDTEAWMGARPCTPDMLPVIGKAPRDASLWFAFGHAHHGLTLGAVTGRLLAEMIVEEPTIVDPAPFSAARFDR
jgi:D-amino-acid dehydrogenase